MMAPTFEILPRSPFRRFAGLQAARYQAEMRPHQLGSRGRILANPFRKMDNSASFESTCSLFRQGLEENFAMEIARWRLFESFAFNWHSKSGKCGSFPWPQRRIVIA